MQAITDTIRRFILRMKSPGYWIIILLGLSAFVFTMWQLSLEFGLLLTLLIVPVTFVAAIVILDVAFAELIFEAAWLTLFMGGMLYKAPQLFLPLGIACLTLVVLFFYDVFVDRMTYAVRSQEPKPI